ncbi:MAG TPA: DUF971 domain-containing protein [Thermodesulfobacteriota bacterium]
MSTDLRTLPRTAQAIGDEFYGIVWADGHESVYPLQHLRERCPCASCHERRAKGPAGSPSAGVSLPIAGQPGSGAPLALERVEPIGRYALRFYWSDRHDTGIFSFELLRDLCPCESCQGAGQ